MESAKRPIPERNVAVIVVTTAATAVTTAVTVVTIAAVTTAVTTVVTIAVMTVAVIAASHAVVVVAIAVNHAVAVVTVVSHAVAIAVIAAITALAAADAVRSPNHFSTARLWQPPQRLLLTAQCTTKCKSFYSSVIINLIIPNISKIARTSLPLHVFWNEQLCSSLETSCEKNKRAINRIYVFPISLKLTS